MDHKFGRHSALIARDPYIAPILLKVKENWHNYWTAPRHPHPDSYLQTIFKNTLNEDNVNNSPDQMYNLCRSIIADVD